MCIVNINDKLNITSPMFLKGRSTLTYSMNMYLPSLLSIFLLVGFQTFPFKIRTLRHTIPCHYISVSLCSCHSWVKFCANIPE